MNTPINETHSTAQASARAPKAPGQDQHQPKDFRNPVTGQVTLQLEEERQSFNAFITTLIASLDPKTPIEQQLALSYASAQWRINRAAAMEENLFSLGFTECVTEHLGFSYAKTFREHTLAFDKLSMISQRLVNQAEKILNQLMDLQNQRKKCEENELSEATRTYKLYRMQGNTFDPQAHGYTVTIDQIKASIRRSVLKNEALDAEKLDWNSRAYEKKYAQAAA